MKRTMILTLTALIGIQAQAQWNCEVRTPEQDHSEYNKTLISGVAGRDQQEAILLKGENAEKVQMGETIAKAMKNPKAFRRQVLVSFYEQDNGAISIVTSTDLASLGRSLNEEKTELVRKPRVSDFTAAVSDENSKSLFVLQGPYLIYCHR